MWRPRSIRVVNVILTAFLLLVGCVLDARRAATSAGQEAAVPATHPAATTPQDGPIVPGDLLAIEIEDLVAPGVWTRRIVRVDDQGDISMPLAKLHVAGYSPEELGPALPKLYGERSIDVSGEFRVTRLKAASPTQPTSFVR